MLSVTEVKRKLPKEFVDSLYEEYTPLTVDKILMGMSGERNTSLRVNTLKSNIYELMNLFKENNIKFERVSWYKDALEIKNVKEKELQKLPQYEKGDFYIQSLSSMVPPLVLSPKPGEHILDVTAAPGSKTTQIAALMQNKGEIIANELDKIRFKRLVFNIEKQGASIAKAINLRGELLYKEYNETFDKVLLDAPCSGEGRFQANDAKTYRQWSKKEVIKLSKLQKKLLKSAYLALKPNGILIYSTCTLNEEENEKVLDWAINNLKLKMLDINIEITGAKEAFTNNVDESIKKAIRILPTKSQEGFFIAKLQKIK